MQGYNRVTLAGNLTRDPEVRTTTADQKVGKFGLAVNRRYRDRNDQTKEETTFVDCEIWGAQCGVLERYCTKGSPLLVEGRLKLDQWEDKEGGKRSKLMVTVERLILLGSGGSTEADAGRSAGTGRPPLPPQEAIDEDDVPF